MKRDIYKALPENFHRQFEQTLSQLEDGPSGAGKRHGRYGLILAAAVLACASLTAVAAGVLQWHDSMSAHFGTDRELEDKLSMEHVAKAQDAVTEGNGLKFQALQAVRTDAYCYFLIEMTVPDDIKAWNGDILFEECEVVGKDFGCTCGFVEDSFADQKVLMELQVLYYEEDLPDGTEIRVRLKDLVQTERTETAACLAEGEWEINLDLPAAADAVRFYPAQVCRLGEHTLSFDKIDISPFRIRMYEEKEAALHAVWGHSVYLAGVRYEDGTVVEEGGMQLSMSGHTDEAEEFCLEISLDTAVDPDKTAALLFRDGEAEREITLGRIRGEGSLEKQDGDTEDIKETDDVDKDEAGRNTLPSGNGMEGRISDVRILYVSYENVVYEEGRTIWLWDAHCGGKEELVSLADCGFSREQGGEIGMTGSGQIQILPEAQSKEIYLYTIADRSLLTLDTETFWPWAGYESYLERFQDIADIIPEADERYSAQAHLSQGGWYYLYSEDGSVRNMELKVIEE